MSAFRQFARGRHLGSLLGPSVLGCSDLLAVPRKRAIMPSRDRVFRISRKINRQSRAKRFHFRRNQLSLSDAFPSPNTDVSNDQ